MKQLKGKARECKLAELCEQVRLIYVGATGVQPEDSDDCLLATIGGADIEAFFRGIAAEFFPNTDDARRALVYWSIHEFESLATAAEHILQYQEIIDWEAEQKGGAK